MVEIPTGSSKSRPVLFATTIKENILFGKGASMDNVINAAKAANAHDFIVKLPDGYETQVSPLHILIHTSFLGCYVWVKVFRHFKK